MELALIYFVHNFASKEVHKTKLHLIELNHTLLVLIM